MRKNDKTIILIIMTCILLLSGCSNTRVKETQLANLNDLGKNKPVIVTTELYSKWLSDKLNELPIFQSSSLQGLGWDLRSYDLSSLNLSGHSEELKYVAFDTDTVWPNNLPTDFDPSAIMELGRDPGLGIRTLHERGITGKGVNIAIIDEALLLEHEEYKDNIMLYERLNCQDQKATMHGPGVASLAVGQNVGVAPDAKLYYIASTFGKIVDNKFEVDLTIMADGIKRVLEINKHLSDEEKIRVISISRGIDDNSKGIDEVIAAIELAKQSDVFVITTTTSINYDFTIMGLGRDLMSDPNDANSYVPGLFWSDTYYSGEFQRDNLLLVPIDARTYASTTGEKDYAFSSVGGLSWASPWLAGLYALCVQVNPQITIDEFIQLAIKTGDEITVEHEAAQYTLKTMINPVKLVDAIEHPDN